MTERERASRKIFLVDRGMQLGVAFTIAATMLGLAAAYALSFWVLSTQEIGPTSSSVNRLGMLVTGAYFLLSTGVTLIVGIRATHRIAGSALVIERAVRGLRAGDFGQRLTLRKDDHMQSLAAELAAFRDELQAEQCAERAFVETLGEALARGDHEAARRLQHEHARRLASVRAACETKQELPLAA